MSNKNDTIEKVKVKIPLERDKKEDVFVALNGKTYLIKRGKEVEVPIGVAKILEHSEKMTMTAIIYEEMLSATLTEMENK